MGIGSRISTLSVLVFLTVWCFGQTDSSVLTYEAYLKTIIQHHPIAKKADLQRDLASAERRLARGMLDPMLSANWDEKRFDDKLYYRQYQGSFKIPTPIGIDVVGGYENSDGIFLNPEYNTDEFGLWHVGVEVNLLQGLVFNERGLAIQQARIFQEMSENERAIILNDLLYNGSKAYLKWQQYYYFTNVLNENIQLARTYFESTRISFENGEKSAMDTLEAYIFLQDANNLYQKNRAVLISTRQQLENYIWYEDDPVVLRETTVPEDYENELYRTDPKAEVTDVVNNHPMLLSYMNKQFFLEAERRFKRNKALPKLKAKFNPLLRTSSNSIRPEYVSSDYKWGFDFTMPLLFRSGRAEVERTEIKLREVMLDTENLRNKLTNSIENSRDQQSVFREQIDILEQNLEGYRLLLEGENEKFRFGESSIFLLNKRQEKYIDGRLKLIELNIRLQMEMLNQLYYSNDLLAE